MVFAPPQPTWRNNISVMVYSASVTLVAKINATSATSVSPCGETGLVHRLDF
jgi:hypothetical protein